MPPLGLLPGRPAGAPDIVSTGYGAGVGPASSAVSTVEKWEAEMAAIQAALREAAGFERIKLERQYEDAAKARDNAMAMARLQAETSRYGVDVGRKNLLAQLEQNDRQFQQNHALEWQKLGLSRAQTATEYLSSPDRWMQAADYLNMSSRVLAGQGGPSPYGTTGAPRMKNEGDFAVLEGGGGSPDYAGRGSALQAGASAGGAGADARLKALRAVMDAVPPSQSPGIDENDYAVLAATKALYSTGLKPGDYERMRPGQQAMFQSAGRRLGYDPNEFLTNYRRSLPGQGAARRA